MARRVGLFVILIVSVLALSILAGSGPRHHDGTSAPKPTPSRPQLVRISDIQSSVTTFPPQLDELNHLDTKQALHGIHINLMQQRSRVVEIESRLGLIERRLEGLEYSSEERQERFILLLRRALNRRNSNGRHTSTQPHDKPWIDRP